MVEPELASAYFLRAWSAFLVQADINQIRSDLERATQLSPEDLLFSDSLRYLNGLVDDEN